MIHKQLEGLDSWITSLTFNRKSKDKETVYLAAAHDPIGTSNATIVIYKVPDPSDCKKWKAKWNKVIIPTQHTRRITSLMFVGSATLISASEDGFACAWRIPDYKSTVPNDKQPMVHSSKMYLFEERYSPIQHDVGIVDMAIITKDKDTDSEKDGGPEFLVTGDRDGEVRIWNLELMNSWFRGTDSKGPLHFTEANIAKLLTSDDKNVEAICAGASTSFTSFTQTRLYEGTRFRKTKWKYTKVKTEPGGDHYDILDTRQEVNIQNMANDLSFLGADFISSCRKVTNHGNEETPND